MDLTDLGTAVFAILGVAAGFVPWLFPNASRRTKWIAVVACIALMAVAFGFGVREWNKANTSAAEVRSATQVRECMTQHQVGEAETVTTLPPRTNEDGSTEYVTLYKKCVWPPPSWANPDGYSEIRVTDTDGPGAASRGVVEMRASS